MKHTLLYIAAAALATSAALSSCDDNFTHPPVIMPPSTSVEATLPLIDFKSEYWASLSDPMEVPYQENGDTIILTGRVCSSDESGNLFKSIIVQSVDEAGEQVAINLSVNSYDLYKLFPYGQEVAIYASGMSVGGYRGLLQFGAPNDKEMTFMDVEDFKEHVIRNNFALPEPNKVVVTEATVADIIAAKANPTSLMKWQSRLVRVSDVEFVFAGYPCAPTQSENRYVVDADGNRLNVRMSSYATFKNNILPMGKGSVQGILSYYNNDWQLVINDWDDLTGFENTSAEPVEPVAPAGEGTMADPYNVAKVLELIASGNIPANEVYFKGTVFDISELDPSFGNATYYIVDKRGLEPFMVYRGYGLGGEKFATKDALKAGDEVIVLGKLMSYNGTPETSQGSKIMSLNGVLAPGVSDKPVPTVEPAGSGTAADPYNVARTLDIISKGEMTDAEVYVKGTIASIKEIDTGSYGNASFYISDVEGGDQFYIFRSYWLDKAKFTATDQLAVGAEVVMCGKLINYMDNTPEMAQGGYVYSYNGQSGNTPTPSDPTPSDPEASYTCEKVTSIVSGESYVLVVDGQFGAAISSTLTYGRLTLTDANISGGKFSVDAANLITFTEVAGKGYTMVDAQGRYLAMQSGYNTNFQLFTELKDGCYYTAAFGEDGKLTLTNTLTGCVVCVSKGAQGTYYTNMAPALSPADPKLPELYKATKN